MHRYGKRIILEVPYKEKDEAKALGAWWDAEIKKWFIHADKDVAPFRRWLPAESESAEKHPDPLH